MRPHDLTATRARRLAAFALIAASLVPLAGCWPLAPIVAIAAASGGGGGGGGKGSPAAALSGTIVTSSTVFDTSVETLDREPNDSLGMATPLGTVTTRSPRHLEGSAGVAASLHALVAGGGGRVDVLFRDLLEGRAGDDRRYQVGSAERPAPVAIARTGTALVLLDVAGGKASVRVTPLGGLLVKRHVELGLDVDPAGFAACFDSLLLLDRSLPSARVVAFDDEDGRPLVIDDLQRGGLAHLAGGDELLTGRPRLFTCEPKSGELFEIAVTESGDDRRFGGLVARGAPRGLAGGIAALAYDGALLHAVDGAGTLHSFDPDSLRELGSRTLLAAGERAVSLAVRLDLGVDGYHVELPAGTSLHVELALAGARPDARFFLTAIDRATIVQRQLESPATHRRTTTASETLALDLAAPPERPRGFDLVIGALHGQGSYELALGTRARAPAPPTPAPPTNLTRDERDAASVELAAALDERFLARIAGERLGELYRDPLIENFIPDRLVLGRASEAAALALPKGPAGLALSQLSRSPSGYDLVAVATTAGFAGPAARSLHGAASRRSVRREQARALLAALDGIAGAPGLAWAEPQYLVHSLAVPNDPGFAADQLWHYNLMNLPAAWNVTHGLNTTVLACIDTGIRTDNTDLLPQPAGNVGTHGFDFVSGTGGGDGNGIDPDPFDPGTFASNSNHGSHTAGTMGAKGNNGTHGTGICWDCELMPLRGLDTAGSGSTTDIAEAMRYAARLSNASGILPPQRAAVINLSLGLSQSSNVIHDALINAVAQGCVVMCATGNDARNDLGMPAPVLFPAAFPEAIAVAAADHNGNVAYYSNSGPEVDVTCSGGDAAAIDGPFEVWSTVGIPGGSFRGIAGTSMACAHASGIAGLMATVNPALNQNSARNILRFTATDIETVGVDDLSGFGLVDAAAAVNAAPASLSLSAATVDFGNTGTHLVVQALTAAGVLTVDPNFTLTATYTPAAAPAPTTAWLTATLMPDGKTIQLAADRSVLVDGDYRVRVDVTTDAGSGSFEAGITVDGSGITETRDVIVAVVDVDGSTVLAFTTATAAGGYAWSFAGLPLGNGPSEYLLVAGIDVDGNFVINEPGEPFGAYPDVANPTLLEFSPAAPVRNDLIVK